MIARCLSSSLAKMGTRSSGMGLFNYTPARVRMRPRSHNKMERTLKLCENLTNSAMRLSISLFTNA